LIQYVREAHLVLRHELFDFVRRLTHVNGENDKPIVFVALIEGFESAPLPLAVGSPCRPKVQQDDLATERLQGHVFAIGIGETEGWHFDCFGKADKAHGLKV
jgi:hypothetical protein